VHSNLMGVCIQRGLYDEAQRAAVQAYGAAAAMTRSAPLGVCHQGAGLIAYARGDSERAMELLEQSLSCYEQDLPINVPMNAHVDAGAVLAECHAERRQLERAFSSQRRHFEVYRRRIETLSRGQIAAAKARQNAAASISLSEREIECLSWSAAGKTAWETGRIMELSEWTVVYHIEKAKRKFGLTRKQAVIARAISLGLIKPDSATW
jgi:DNA-binding CsgD family transcriptional regulator